MSIGLGGRYEPTRRAALPIFELSQPDFVLGTKIVV